MKLDSDRGAPVVDLYHAGDSWVVCAHYGDPHPEALVILPAPDAPGLDHGGQGITSAVLRKVPLSEITAEGRQLSTLWGAELARRALRKLSDAGDRRRDDLYYALVADAYVSTTSRGDKRPVMTLALVTGSNVETMRSRIREARNRGLLTGESGKAGGSLTDKAREMLKLADS